MDNTKPEYKFSLQITDDTTGEVIVTGSTFISSIAEDGSCEAVDFEVAKALRYFQSKGREAYEEAYYPESETTDDEI